ncbi:MAG: hypothetical protein WCK49_11285, partial [Myxococcaceae bacterium]
MKTAKMKYLLSISLIVTSIIGATAMGSSKVISYKEIEQEIEAWKTQFKKDHGFVPNVAMNPQYFTKQYTPNVSDETVSGLNLWVKATLSSLDKLAKDTSKTEALKQKVSAVVFMGYDKEGLSDKVERQSGKGGGLVITQSVKSFTAGPPSQFAQLMEKAIFEPTKREKLEAEMEKLKPLRGK